MDRTIKKPRCYLLDWQLIKADTCVAVSFVSATCCRTCWNVVGLHLLG